MSDLLRANSSSLRIIGIALCVLWPYAGLCNEVGQNNEETSQELATKAARMIKAGNHDAGVILLKKAICRNSDDFGQSYVPKFDAGISGYQWGELQLLNMLDARPSMNDHIGQGDLLWRWARASFSGGGTHKGILWDSTQPIANADHFPRTKSSIGRVRVSRTHVFGPRKGEKLSFEEAWSSAVFELHNIENSESFVQIQGLALRGEISKSRFIKAYFGLEFVATQETRAFYTEVFLPWAADKEMQTNPDLWYTSSLWWGSLDDCFMKYHDQSNYPFEPYGSYYDGCANYFLSTLERRGDREVTNADIEAIANISIRDQRATNALVAALGSCDPLVSGRAGQVIGNLELTSSVLKNHLVPKLKSQEAIDAILKIRVLGESAASASTALVAQLEQSDDLGCVEILETLRTLGSPPAELLPKLVELLSSKKPQVRIKALQSIGRLGDCATEVLPSIIILLSDPDEEVSSSALDMIIDLKNQNVQKTTSPQ